MTCAACVNRVEKKLAKLDGVSATVNLATGRARVRHPVGITADELVAVVVRTGYTAEPPPAAGPARGPRGRGGGGSGGGCFYLWGVGRWGWLNNSWMCFLWGSWCFFGLGWGFGSHWST
ncbi:heavy-metal-associated domain-containing protein, partial [Streptomyces lasiicapitis]|uniref:heavy-metal-associated domain-containing protein n=1 Tax=Streptomyces lasiicapitis TaxID=1923961 RepID=UPI0036BDE85D